MAALIPAIAGAQTESIEYYGLDHLGSVRVIFNQSGQLVDRMDYGPFGENLKAAIKFPVEQFAQLARDSETGRDYAEARNYSPGSGRFNRPDPVVAGLSDPQQWNRYSYAINSPITSLDPRGLYPIDVAASFGARCLLECPFSAPGKYQSQIIGESSSLVSELFSEVVGSFAEWLEGGAWVTTQVVDIFTGTTVTGSTVPGEDEIVPTPRAAPNSPVVEAAVYVAGVGSLFLPGPKGSTSRILGMSPGVLQKGFQKHGIDFGLSGKWNPARASDFSVAVHRHINDVNTKEIVGFYRGQPAINFVNANTGLTVVARPDLTFWTGFQATGTQLQRVLGTGWLW